MKKTELLYEGKAKKVFRTDNDDTLHVEYKDDATAFDGKKKEMLSGKGRLNNEISALIFAKLHELGIPNHFIERISQTEQRIRKAEMIPLEVVVRNRAAGSLVKRLGLERGQDMTPPVIEWYLKDDNLGDPLINEEHIRVLGAAAADELTEMKALALRCNTALIELFQNAGLILVDFKLEFGRDHSGRIILADEISPDTCRLWDAKTGDSLDKDLFRFDGGNLQAAYETIFSRLGGLTNDV
ncbi:phosphoribosylaminoimidazolesuccinocarboxamide synthase [Salisediminibacterium halotolerans]|uniref:phosphoribosylaminoimidazolesuccinocarboxamide synthase n=1 Tax=Salisediminibacterium halotolerans TaxID=517425 RepID=UPI000EAB969D|nr:phosphoribosylaminoimidazolesuccinocarboxamide synthase [Salisediminibacterium halotolerans]RLJ71761.1 phosphoribosylaminoimidazole-succinocarboxamide synthase [Actinophytocola xinjiangensis]RPE86911.1 phosphoribosylaminoimidazole-succinocarboxamide synthase [Salisediminibacterium halotolerans]TWG32974.1 phosphoribosylaminoimidazole-succinocarboxamide synthase [Salisediminibacterium halotolerans]GEL08572.1 phosphoribosylaminoimidazole-succinocarboxamide synthase [Salisediminibacterium haloto